MIGKDINELDVANNIKRVSGECESKPTIFELEQILKMSYPRLLKIVHTYDLGDYVDLCESSNNGYKNEIISYIKSLATDINTVEHSDGGLNSGETLDLYFPDLKQAIEINDSYWSSDIFKTKTYHQNKTLDYIRKRINLLQIFEYEWLDIRKQSILKNMIANRIADKREIVYARKCEVRAVTSKECTKFLLENHLQSSVQSPIAYGLIYNSKLIGLMTFGKPRFASLYDYELLRLAWDSNVKVVGGSERLFKHFISEHNPNTIVSYCDISKFRGDVYFNLGFKSSSDLLTSPNYVWFNPITKDTKPRYQTMKHKLIARGLGTLEQTEVDIMLDLGYIRIHDCGNLKFIWDKTN